MDTLYYVFFIAVIILFLFRLYLKSNHRVEEAETAQWVAIGLLVAAIICKFIDRLFPKWFYNKPSGEDIDTNGSDRNTKRW